MSKSGPYYQPLFLIGVSHKTLPVEERERLAHAHHGLDASGITAHIASEVGASQCVILSTCNRFEIVTFGLSSEKSVLAYIQKILPSVDLDRSVYCYRDRDAVAHLFRVAASLDSMAVGEAQILGQVKDAYRTSVHARYAHKEVHSLFQCAFRVAKRVRGETGIAEKGVSISSIAVQLAKKIFEDLSERKVLIIGSGKMAELTAIHLKAQGCHRVVVANRTIEKAVELAELLGGKAISLQEIPHALDEVDMVVGSIHTDSSIIDTRTLRARRRRTPLFLIDLGVPRNFSPALGEIDDVYLYNIDDLAAIADENKSARAQEGRDAEILIEYGVHRFESWLRKIQQTGSILSLRSRVHELCQEEIHKALSGVLSPDESAMAVEKLTHVLSQKLAQQVQDILTTLHSHEEGVVEKRRLTKVLPYIFDQVLEFSEGDL